MPNAHFEHDLQDRLALETETCDSVRDACEMLDALYSAQYERWPYSVSIPMMNVVYANLPSIPF